MAELLQVDGPADPDRTMIHYDIPFAPDDAKKSLKLRQKLGLDSELRAVDVNVRVVIDSFIPPRTWEENGVRWVQHASPFPTTRIDTVKTRDKLHKMAADGACNSTGVCPTRSVLYAECFLEMIRQVTAEQWERGLLLLKIHAERIESLKAHRALYESRTGYAFRLALKGERDASNMHVGIGLLKVRLQSLATEEEGLKQKCDNFASYSEEQLLVDDKKYNDELNALKKEATQKRNQLEALTAPIPKQ